MDRLLRSPLFDRTDLSSLRKGYYGASIMPVEVLRETAAGACRTCGSGTSTARPRSRRWRPCSSPKTSCASRARPAGRCSTSRRAWSTTRCSDVAAGRGRRDRAPLAAAAAGLLQRPDERTAAAFEGGWFHSGDLATIDDEGYITVVDRKKDMIKTGGENVASREVEEAIYRLPQVSRGGGDRPAASALDRGRDGRGRRQARTGARCRACSRTAQQQLAGFKAPKDVFFGETLPKNPSGKMLKRELRQRYSRPGPICISH